MKKIVKLLTIKNKTISTMESCTGGALVNAITDIPGASDILKFSAITYSNEFKVKMGIKQKTIDDFTVYSMEVAQEMSKKICEYTSSSYGVGITGHMMVADKKNVSDSLDRVFISIYDNDTNKYYNKELELIYFDRVKNKKYIVNKTEKMLIEILKQL